MLRPTRALALMAAGALTVTLAACGGGSEQASPEESARAAAAAALFTGPAGQTVSLDMADLKYSTGSVTAKAGEVIEIALANKGSIDHDVSFKELPGDAALRVDGKEKDVDAGKTAIHAHMKSGSTGALRLKVSTPGTYEFYCSVAGHKEAGMKGTLTVQ